MRYNKHRLRMKVGHSPQRIQLKLDSEPFCKSLITAHHVWTKLLSPTSKIFSDYFLHWIAHLEMPLSFLQPSPFEECLAERRETEFSDLEEMVRVRFSSLIFVIRTVLSELAVHSGSWRASDDPQLQRVLPSSQSGADSPWYQVRCSAQWHPHDCVRLLVH